MIQIDEYFRFNRETNKIGFSSNDTKLIPYEYLENKQFVIFRTCHSFGDWVIISAMPKLLKKKYPDCTVVVPSPTCLSKYFSPNNWKNKHDNPFNNVVEVFINNPYVDGMIDEIPEGMPIYHDHFRIYDESNPNIPLVEQMLAFWRFTPEEFGDSQPDLYWSDLEYIEGDMLINKYMGNSEYGFLYLDDEFFRVNPNTLREPLELKQLRIQEEIDKHDLKWFYYYGDNISKSMYILNSDSIDIRELHTTLRIQNYIKSKSKLVIGHQGGFGTDCMPRYTNCYVIPIAYKYINEHIIRGTTYLSCHNINDNIKI
jgi:hypothetical protein